jgi:hypothetical protein
VDSRYGARVLTNEGRDIDQDRLLNGGSFVVDNHPFYACQGDHSLQEDPLSAFGEGVRRCRFRMAGGCRLLGLVGSGR